MICFNCMSDEVYPIDTIWEAKKPYKIFFCPRCHNLFYKDVDNQKEKERLWNDADIGVPLDVIKVVRDHATEKTLSTDCKHKNQTLIPYSRKDLRTASTTNSVLFRNEVFPSSNRSFILSVKILGIEIESYSFVMIIEYKLPLLKIMVIIHGNCTDPSRYLNDRDREKKIDLNMSIIFCIIWIRYIYRTEMILKLKK